MSTATPTDAATGPAAPAPDEGREAALHAALARGDRPQRPGPLTPSLMFAWRAMRKIRHVPEQLIDVTITPVLFLVMFTYLFGGAIAGSTSEYLEFILPGILVQAVLFTTVYSGVTLNTDMTKGVVDRFRSLPMWSPAPLVGAAAGDVVRYLVASTVTVLVGFVLGYGAGGGVLGVLGGVALVVLFAFGLAWVFTTLGLLLRSPNAVMNTGFMALFPLVFLSNILIDPSTTPAAVEAFVDVNPVTHVTTAVRGLMGGEADAGDIGLVLGETALLTAAFVPLTTRMYRGRS